MSRSGHEPTVSAITSISPVCWDAATGRRVDEECVGRSESLAAVVVLEIARAVGGYDLEQTLDRRPLEWLRTVRGRGLRNKRKPIVIVAVAQACGGHEPKIRRLSDRHNRPRRSRSGYERTSGSP